MPKVADKAGDASEYKLTTTSLLQFADALVQYRHDYDYYGAVSVEVSPEFERWIPELKAVYPGIAFSVAAVEANIIRITPTQKP